MHVGRYKVGAAIIILGILAVIGVQFFTRNAKKAKTINRTETPVATREATQLAESFETPTAIYAPAQISTETPPLANKTTRSVLKFISVGNLESQFTEDQFQDIARNYDIIRISKGHGNFNRSLQHEAARRLKELNPNIKIYTYFPTSYRDDRDTYGADSFKSEWLLRDRQTGQPIRSESDVAFYVDLSNPDYRQWALGLIADWMKQAPYDGVYWDNANPLGLGDEEDWRKDWANLIGREKMNAWNNGLKELLTGAKRLVGPNKQVIYNGFDRKPWRFNRNLDLLEFADGAMNEGFCYTRGKDVLPKQEILDDINIEIVHGTQHKMIFQKTNFRRATLAGEDRARVGRYCFGSFMLGYQPGYTFFKFGPGYDTKLGEIDINVAEIDLNFGDPQAPYDQEGTVLKRKFMNGWIFVNMESKPSSIRIPEPLKLMNGGQPGPTFQTGQTVDIPASDALFLLKP